MKEAIRVAEILKLLNEGWEPHEGQHEIIYSLFKEGIRDLFVQCGRKWGKTDLVMYLLRRYALLHPGSGCYYIGPFQKQAREITWVTGRIQNSIPKKYIKSINNTEMRVTTIFDSFIKVDGSDNHEAYRGIQPHIVVYDEFKDFQPAFHVAMNPNRAVFDAPCVIIGTPPDREGHYTEVLKSFHTNPKAKHFKFPSHDNPYLNKEWLKNEKEILHARGEHEVWEREYMANFVRGGKLSIFPMLRDNHFHKFDDVMDLLHRDLHKLQFYVVADPGTASCFGVLFFGINFYTKEVFIFDEIYEQDASKTTPYQILLRIREITLEIQPHREWNYVYDEAASWFAASSYELMPELAWVPTMKHFHKRDEDSREPYGLAIIKDALLKDHVKITDRCKNFKWEMENYVKRERRDGSSYVPKKDDHLIDCFRYGLSAADYTVIEREEVSRETEDTRRAYSLEEDLIREGLL